MTASRKVAERATSCSSSATAPILTVVGCGFSPLALSHVPNVTRRPPKPKVAPTGRLSHAGALASENADLGAESLAGVASGSAAMPNESSTELVAAVAPAAETAVS